MPVPVDKYISKRDDTWTLNSHLLHGAAMGVILLWLLALEHEDPKLPPLFDNLPPTPALLAHAVNHYVSLGESKAFAQMDRYLMKCKATSSLVDGRMLRVAWVCRLLYEAKNKEQPLHPPAFGALDGVPYMSMPSKDWPFFPLAKGGDSYFVLGEGYVLYGSPEDPRHYLQTCRYYGKFRTEPIVVPNKDQARNDLVVLLKSPKWNDLKWTDGGNGWHYELSIGPVLKYLMGQVDRMDK